MKIGEPKTPSGIMIGDTPLEDFVKEKEEKEVKELINGEFHSLVHSRGKALYRAPIIRNGRNSHGIRRRTRVLTDDEIRREKGLAMKTTGSHHKDVIWLLSEGLTIDTHRVVKELGFTGKRASTRASNYIYLVRKFLPDYLVTDESTIPFKVRLKPDLKPEERTFDHLCSVYAKNQQIDTRMKIKAKKAKEKPPEAPVISIPPPEYDYVERVPYLDMMKQIDDEIYSVKEKVLENTRLLNELAKIIDALPKVTGEPHRLVIDVNFNFNLGKK